MAIAYFCKNTSFDMDGREYQLNQEISAGIWQAQEVRTGRIHELSTQALQQHYAEGKLVFMDDAEKSAKTEKAFNEKTKKISHQTKDAEWENAKIKRMYVKAVEHLPCTSVCDSQRQQGLYRSPGAESGVCKRFDAVAAQYLPQLCQKAFQKS